MFIAGATVMMVPLAMNMANIAGADPRLAALVVAVACSNTFVLPTHQVMPWSCGQVVIAQLIISRREAV